jgi:uncharacterized membrane protein YgcG
VIAVVTLAVLVAVLMARAVITLLAVHSCSSSNDSNGRGGSRCGGDIGSAISGGGGAGRIMEVATMEAVATLLRNQICY